MHKTIYLVCEYEADYTHTVYRAYSDIEEAEEYIRKHPNGDLLNIDDIELY